jgi:hypothetical protein
MKKWIGIVVSVGLAVGVATSSFAQGRDAANFAGNKACGICHKKEESGNQMAKWAEGPHAKAFEKLGSPEAKEVAKKLGIDDPQKSGKCLICHSTAYNFTEACVTEKIKPEEGVTCESCHGPGKKYMLKSVMEDRAKAIEAGLIYPADKSCELCHNEKSPTWKGFKKEEALKKIAHPDPKVKK